MSASASMSLSDPNAWGMPKRPATARARPGTVSAIAVTVALPAMCAMFGSTP
jgi:hypothetical protein